jgi:hypothetical protein
MSLILLTGAGFSRNWGGWLANEAFEYLLGQDGLHPRVRRLLWDHKERGTGFEGVYQALKEGATNPIDQAIFKQFHEMVAGMFHSMGHGFELVSLGGAIQTFLASFDAIFTLNQDTLLELQYIGGDILQHSTGRFFDCEVPGLDSTDASIAPPGLLRPNDGPFSVTERYQPYFKLHGSSNWVLPDRSNLMLILGGNKAAEIPKQPLLAWYHEQFRRMLLGAQVVIIGYSFHDEHINNDLMDAAASGARFFIIDPAGVDIIDKRKLAQIPQPREPLMEALMECIDGASRRPLLDTFSRDDNERRKLDHFMTVSWRRPV